MIHLDTSFVIDLLREARRERFGAAHELLESMSGESVAISVFVLCELQEGIAAAARPEDERAAVDGLLSAVLVVYPDERIALAYADAANAVRRSGRTIAAMDLLIGVAALVEGARLATRNVRHFSQLAELSLLRY